MTEEENKIKKEEGIKELVLARINFMPSNYKLSIGSEGTFTKDELIQQVSAGSEIGNQVITMQMNFIRALTSGKLLKTINQNG
ncbi:MAG: hypothetical protein KJ949_03000 [Nanoarchaeota archaeon]|nr:hypothetical protein [Nanoarchaeota archaeon]MBU4308738.1 hypothetical protein [Nanoarchaeota archaeon]